MTFTFDEQDLLQLLKAYYAGASKHQASHLQRMDMQPELPRCASGILDRSRLSGGNALLRQFTHQQVDWAIQQLRGHETVRAGKRITGWLEYCLKVMIGQEKTECEANALMPEVRKQDKVKALMAMGQLLSQVVGHIDRPREPIRRETRLDELLQKLDRLNGSS